MNTEEVSAIETHLKLKLPSKYRETRLPPNFHQGICRDHVVGICRPDHRMDDPAHILMFDRRLMLAREVVID